MAIVEFKDVTRVYTSGDHELRALDGVNFTLDEGKFVVILGPSGAGKSTLMIVWIPMVYAWVGTSSMEAKKRALALMVDSVRSTQWVPLGNTSAGSLKPM